MELEEKGIKEFDIIIKELKLKCQERQEKFEIEEEKIHEKFYKKKKQLKELKN